MPRLGREPWFGRTFFLFRCMWRSEAEASPQRSSISLFFARELEMRKLGKFEPMLGRTEISGAPWKGASSLWVRNPRNSFRWVEIFYGVNARIWANPVSCSHITFFVGCSLLPPNRKSAGIRTIRTTPTLRGANQSSRTETHTPNPLLPLDLHYSIRNVHPFRFGW